MKQKLGEKQNLLRSLSSHFTGAGKNSFSIRNKNTGKTHNQKWRACYFHGCWLLFSPTLLAMSCGEALPAGHEARAERWEVRDMFLSQGFPPNHSHPCWSHQAGVGSTSGPWVLWFGSCSWMKALDVILGMPITRLLGCVAKQRWGLWPPACPQPGGTATGTSAAIFFWLPLPRSRKYGPQESQESHWGAGALHPSPGEEEEDQLRN